MHFFFSRIRTNIDRLKYQGSVEKIFFYRDSIVTRSFLNLNISLVSTCVFLFKFLIHIIDIQYHISRYKSIDI